MSRASKLLALLVRELSEDLVAGWSGTRTLPADLESGIVNTSLSRLTNLVGPPQTDPIPLSFAHDGG